MSQEQEELIAQNMGQNGRVILMFDGDEAGQRCTDQVASRLIDRLFVRAVRLDSGCQPDKLSEEEIRNFLAK